MKKVIGILMLLMLVAGLFGFNSAMAASCAGPVAVDCDYDSDGDGDTDAHCLLFVDLAENDPGIGVICQTAPAA